MGLEGFYKFAPKTGGNRLPGNRGALEAVRGRLQARRAWTTRASCESVRVMLVPLQRKPSFWWSKTKGVQEGRMPVVVVEEVFDRVVTELGGLAVHDYCKEIAFSVGPSEAGGRRCGAEGERGSDVCRVLRLPQRRSLLKSRVSV
jgi:hypothetical protein